MRQLRVIYACGMCAGSNEDWFGLAARPPVVTLGRSKLTKSRILVCAPSNAALDEIVVRVLRSGLLSGAGAKIVPNIVRAGVATRMHSSVSGVTLDSLITAQVGANSDYHVVRPCHRSAALRSAACAGAPVPSGAADTAVVPLPWCFPYSHNPVT